MTDSADEQTLVLLEVRDRYAVVTLNRPLKRNAVSVAMARQLRDVLAQVEGVPVVVITGSGSAFCSGIDLKERAGRPRTFTETLGAGDGQYWADTIDAIRRHPAVFIAAVNGQDLFAAESWENGPAVRHRESGMICRFDPDDPRNAVIVVWGVAALVTCTILPSNVAFTSLVSAAGVPSAAAYGLICLGRLLCTPNRFPKPQWSLGRWSKPFQFIGVFWNGWVVAILFSPYVFPVTGQTLNCKFPLPACWSVMLTLLIDAPIIMAGVTILALISYFVMPESAWLPRNRITHFIDSKGAGNVSETVEEVTPSAQNDTAQRS